MGRDFDSVAEFYTSDDLGQLILSLQAPPAFRSRHDQLEHHEPRGVLRKRALHANRAMSNRGKGAFNWIRRAQMRPVLSGEIEERQQGVAVLDQAIDSLVVFGRVFLGEDGHCSYRMAARFGGRLALSKVHWVRPELVAEITYLTWSDDALLRHTVFVGLREDKPAREVRRETPAH